MLRYSFVLHSAPEAPLNPEQFMNRKADHIRHSLAPESEASDSNALGEWTLLHDSLPDLDLSDIRIDAEFLGIPIATPFYIAGMTAGHPDARLLNERLARACARRGWGFGSGSQRRELESTYQDPSVLRLKEENPSLKLISNLGASQLPGIAARGEWSRVLDLLERSRADALAIHLNPLQEAIQPEGTPTFRGALSAIETLLSKTKIPVILKETGSGMSRAFLTRIAHLPLHAVDVSGLGGTHWGRIEGFRADPDSPSAAYGQEYGSWGISTPDSILSAREILKSDTRIWASGGVRSGLDAAKCLALGAHQVGFARPALIAALEGEEALDRFMAKVEGSLRIALFCTNSETLRGLGPEKITKFATVSKDLL